MNELELKFAFMEYDIAITNVKQTLAHGYDNQMEMYRFICNQKKQLANGQPNVMFRTDFLEVTYNDFLSNKRDVDSTIAKLGVWHQGLIRSNIETIDWDAVIYNANANNLADIINRHYDNISDETYWKIIGHCYTSSELGHSDTEVIAEYLNCPRSNRHYLMNEEERNLLANLPDQVTIYRGCSAKEVNSTKLRFSWTLDREIAESFANDYTTNIYERLEGKDKSKYVVIERAINKDEIVAYFTGRGESEILYFPKN